jgi:transcriptional regulator with XRE-family HTH domain
MPEYDKIVKQLKDRKKELGLTQAQIAERMQVERVRVNELFSSKKTNMTVKTLINLCNALNVTIHFNKLNKGK